MYLLFLGYYDGYRYGDQEDIATIDSSSKSILDTRQIEIDSQFLALTELTEFPLSHLQIPSLEM